jgi:hypothetical protein
MAEKSHELTLAKALQGLLQEFQLKPSGLA